MPFATAKPQKIERGSDAHKLLACIIRNIPLTAELAEQTGLGMDVTVESMIELIEAGFLKLHKRGDFYWLEKTFPAGSA